VTARDWLVTPSTFVVEGEWLKKQPFCPAMEFSQTINAIHLFAWIQNLLASGSKGGFFGRNCYTFAVG
jgi:hypothetical protein